jgi:hypothetical protein
MRDEHPMEDAPISDALRATLAEAIRESKRLDALGYEMVGPRTFEAMKGAAVVIVRQRDTHGRRCSMFCQLNVSKSLNGQTLAAEIAAAMQAAEAASAAGPSASPWQPIETAPKAYGMLGVNFMVAALSGADDGSLVVGECERDEDGNFWWANERGDYHASPITHRVRYWQPMPDPPVSLHDVAPTAPKERP